MKDIKFALMIRGQMIQQLLEFSNYMMNEEIHPRNVLYILYTIYIFIYIYNT